MKNRNPILVAALSLLFCMQVYAASDVKYIGVGFILGSPTAITGKFWMTPEAAIDAGLSWSVNDYFLVYGDYLFHFPGAFGRSSKFASELMPYVGGGLLVAITSNSRRDHNGYLGRDNGSFGAGFRIPLGLEWVTPRPRFGIFLEIVPGIALFPATSMFFQGGIGARFYF